MPFVHQTVLLAFHRKRGSFFLLAPSVRKRRQRIIIVGLLYEFYRIMLNYTNKQIITHYLYHHYLTIPYSQLSFPLLPLAMQITCVSITGYIAKIHIIYSSKRQLKVVDSNEMISYIIHPFNANTKLKVVCSHEQFHMGGFFD